MPRVQSSAIRAIDYDAVSRTLFVVFDSGDRYAYSDVPLDLFSAFLAADSKGGFFQERVRGRFGHRRID